MQAKKKYVIHLVASAPWIKKKKTVFIQRHLDPVEGRLPQSLQSSSQSWGDNIYPWGINNIPTKLQQGVTVDRAGHIPGAKN